MQIGGHEDDDEIVRVYRDPAGHPFCLFAPPLNPVASRRRRP